MWLHLCRSSWDSVLSMVLLSVMGLVSFHCVGWSVFGSNTVMSCKAWVGLLPLLSASSKVQMSFDAVSGCERKKLRASFDTRSGPVAFLLRHFA